MALIIPFRDRYEQLAIFVHHIHPILNRQNLEYRIFVIEEVSQIWYCIYVTWYTCVSLSYFLTNRFHVAVHVFSNRSQMMSKCGKNKKKWHTRHSKVCHWYFYHILTSSVTCYWKDTCQHGICLFYIRKNWNVWKKSLFILNFATFTDTKIALWYNLLSIQNEANWLVAMLSKEVWLVQRIMQLSNLNWVLSSSMRLSSNWMISENQSECVHNWAYYISTRSF